VAALVAGAREREGGGVIKLCVALLILALNFYTYHYFATHAVIPERTSFEHFPREFADGWKCPENQAMDERVEANLGVTDYLLCNFENPESQEIVNVYVGYHATQIREEGGGSGDTSIHPPAHCLPGSGWDIVRNQTVPLDLPTLTQPGARVRRLLIAKGEHRQLVYYWYQSQGRVIADDWKKILYVGYDRALRQRTDGALVRFSMPVYRGDEAAADATFLRLAPHIVERLPEYVPN
jgi:EpsI family protein